MSEIFLACLASPINTGTIWDWLGSILIPSSINLFLSLKEQSWSLSLNSYYSEIIFKASLAAAATDGGIEEVKMKLGAWLLIQSIPAAFPTTYPPKQPTPLAKVPDIKSNLWSIPNY